MLASTLCPEIEVSRRRKSFQRLTPTRQTHVVDVFLPTFPDPPDPLPAQCPQGPGQTGRE